MSDDCSESPLSLKQTPSGTTSARALASSACTTQRSIDLSLPLNKKILQTIVRQASSQSLISTQRSIKSSSSTKSSFNKQRVEVHGFLELSKCHNSYEAIPIDKRDKILQLNDQFVELGPNTRWNIKAAPSETPSPISQSPPLPEPLSGPRKLTKENVRKVPPTKPQAQVKRGTARNNPRGGNKPHDG